MKFIWKTPSNKNIIYKLNWFDTWINIKIDSEQVICFDDYYLAIGQEVQQLFGAGLELVQGANPLWNYLVCLVCKLLHLYLGGTLVELK